MTDINGASKHKWFEICKDCYYGDNCISDEEKGELEQCDVFDKLYGDGIRDSLYIKQVIQSDIDEFRNEWNTYVGEFN